MSCFEPPVGVACYGSPRKLTQAPGRTGGMEVCVSSYLLWDSQHPSTVGVDGSRRRVEGDERPPSYFVGLSPHICLLDVPAKLSVEQGLPTFIYQGPVCRPFLDEGSG